VNRPVSILSVGSNDGHVHQSNKGHTSSGAHNANATVQHNHQNQQGSARA
jgi:hypothetical protein